MRARVNKVATHHQHTPRTHTGTSVWKSYRLKKNIYLYASRRRRRRRRRKKMLKFNSTLNGLVKVRISTAWHISLDFMALYALAHSSNSCFGNKIVIQAMNFNRFICAISRVRVQQILPAFLVWRLLFEKKSSINLVFFLFTLFFFNYHRYKNVRRLLLKFDLHI